MNKRQTIERMAEAINDDCGSHDWEDYSHNGMQNREEMRKAAKAAYEASGIDELRQHIAGLVEALETIEGKASGELCTYSGGEIERYRCVQRLHQIARKALENHKAGRESDAN